MSRPTWIELNRQALIDNVLLIKNSCPEQKIIAMVKANAYGCGMQYVVPTIEPYADAFGVACLEEAQALRSYSLKNCILFQGVFEPNEWLEVSKMRLDAVIHHEHQLKWFLETPLEIPVRIWIKIDTGMHRLGFLMQEVSGVIKALMNCPWALKPIGLMTHFACADQKDHPMNAYQEKRFKQFDIIGPSFYRSIANSAWILSHPERTYDVVRPGIMLYGVSPFAFKTGLELGLKPVLSFYSELTAIHSLAVGETVGYGAAWVARRASQIGILSAGYGDGYPRVVTEEACVFIRGQRVPIVGRISMDMMMVDLTDISDIMLGDKVELWGEHLPIEHVAKVSATIPYELLCQLTQRVRDRIQLK